MDFLLPPCLLDEYLFDRTTLNLQVYPFLYKSVFSKMLADHVLAFMK